MTELDAPPDELVRHCVTHTPEYISLGWRCAQCAADPRPCAKQWWLTTMSRTEFEALARWNARPTSEKRYADIPTRVHYQMLQVLYDEARTEQYIRAGSIAIPGGGWMLMDEATMLFPRKWVERAIRPSIRTRIRRWFRR